MSVCNDFITKHPNKKVFLVYSLTTPIEKGKKFSIIRSKGNNEKFLRIHIDKGLLKEIDHQTKKCDFVFIRCKNSDFYFVELKGSDVGKAVKQLRTTISYFNKKYKIESKKIYAYIASSRLPRNADLHFRKLQNKFKKDKIGIELKRQSTHYKHSIS